MGNEPITIIGAGPAGLTAAIVLARHGRKVRVYDRGPDVGHRLSGDFQGLENWTAGTDVCTQLEECGLSLNFLCVPYYGGEIRVPDGAPVEVSSKRPIFYLVRRGALPGTLDMGLKEQALEAGVELVFNRRMEPGGGITIVGTGPRSVDILASGVIFTTGAPDRAAVLFDDRLAPKGYAYLLIHAGVGTLATVMYRDFRREGECFALTREHFLRTGLDVSGERRFASYGNFFLRRSQVEGGTIYVGESAGFQDGLWGFGMRYAILSGYLAARSIIDGTDYDLLWRERLRPLLTTSLVNRYLFERFGDVGYRYLARRLATPDPLAYLQRHYNPSPWKSILFPFVRRSVLSRGHSPAPSLPVPPPPNAAIDKIE